MSINPEQPIVIFDGLCGFCDRFVALALLNDRSGTLIFTSNRSEFGMELVKRLKVSEETANTIIVVHGERVLLRSDAVIFIASKMSSPLSFFTWLKFIPRPLRDLGYRVVARIRRSIPVNHSACALLPPELQTRIRL